MNPSSKGTNRGPQKGEETREGVITGTFEIGVVSLLAGCQQGHGPTRRGHTREAIMGEVGT